MTQGFCYLLTDQKEELVSFVKCKRALGLFWLIETFSVMAEYIWEENLL